jgi:hypothetical protein
MASMQPAEQLFQAGCQEREKEKDGKGANDKEGKNELAAAAAA